jgi:very-short-patch-repair endonuclease
MLIHRSALARADVLQVRGLPATSMLRTLADVSSRLSLTEAVVVVDAALHARRVRTNELWRWIESQPGRPGIRSLRRVAALAEPTAESPMESRLRMLLVLARLPRPVAQVSIQDDRGKFVGRPDLYYKAQRIGIEYDGAIHRTSLAEDNRRQNLLLGAGVRLLRFTAADVMHRPDAIVNQVRSLLASSPVAGKRTTSFGRNAPFASKGLRLG